MNVAYRLLMLKRRQPRPPQSDHLILINAAACYFWLPFPGSRCNWWDLYPRPWSFQSDTSHTRGIQMMAWFTASQVPNFCDQTLVRHCRYKMRHGSATAQPVSHLRFSEELILLNIQELHYWFLMHFILPCATWRATQIKVALRKLDVIYKSEQVLNWV